MAHIKRRLNAVYSLGSLYPCISNNRDRTISDIVNLQDVFLESSKLGRFWLVLFEIFTLIGRLIGRLIFYTFTNTTSGLEFKWRFVSPFKL